jgi:hypothetical protein
MSRGYSTSSSYKPNYYQGGRYNGDRNSYLSSIQEGRATSGGGNGSRGTTPIGTTPANPSVGLSMLADAINGSNNRKAIRESKSYGLSSTFTPAAYKYFSRTDKFYNPTILFNRPMDFDSTTSLLKRECKYFADKLNM